MNPPPFPVVDREPSVSKIVSAFRTSDWRNLALSTGLSAPFGYIVGRPVLMAPSMWCATALGAAGGLCLGMQASFGRLTGYLPNDLERAASVSDVSAVPNAG